MPESSGSKLVTLIGTPLKQSFAARMHNAAYATIGNEFHYYNTEAGPEQLPEVIADLRQRERLVGAAVTRPNKVEVLPYLDAFDAFCEKVGSCNTIVKTPEGQLVGYNTDAYGFETSLREEANVRFEDAVVFCVGAGGVARPIATVLAERGAARVYITDKIEESAHQLAAQVNAVCPPIVEPVPFGDFSKIGECNIVINASGVGMGRSLGVSPVPAEHFNEHTFYYDACYNPTKTQFLLNAEAAGARFLNGVGMSLYQGAMQFEMWTGRKAPLGIMCAELLAAVAEVAGTDIPTGPETQALLNATRATERS